MHEQSREICWLVMPAGEYAVVLHVGPYHRLGEAYGRLFLDWLPSSGRELRDVPAIEVYLNDPTYVAEDDLVTEVRLSLDLLDGPNV